jgi:carbon monoxide dehydrogenase subunit G
MELTNEFRVGVSVSEAWKVLTDVERIAPLLPGAQLQEVEGEEYRGVVKVKVGPITAQYKGQATFVERDEAGGRVVLKASGRDTRGQGNANALISATMTPDGDGTKVSVVTDLTITGKVAQFGRGVLAEVSSKLIGQFVDSLEADIEASGNQPDAADLQADGAAGPAVAAPDNGAGPETDTSASTATLGDGAATIGGVRTISGPEAQPVDLLAVSRDSMLKRLLPLVAVAAVVVVVVVRRRSRARRQGPAVRSRLAVSLPSVHEVAEHLPSVSQLAGHFPSVAQVTEYLPSVGELTGHLPDLRVGDVQAAIRRRH